MVVCARGWLGGITSNTQKIESVLVFNGNIKYSLVSASVNIGKRMTNELSLQAPIVMSCCQIAVTLFQYFILFENLNCAIMDVYKVNQHVIRVFFNTCVL